MVLKKTKKTVLAKTAVKTGSSYLEGIDISHHNNEKGPINWVKLRLVNFVYIKVTEGATNIDPYSERNAKGANDNLIPFGYYHFAHPGNNTAAKEVNNFFNQITKIGLVPTLPYPYVLDLEINHGLDKAQYEKWVNDFITGFQKKFLGPVYPPVIIYGSKNDLDTFLSPDHKLGTYSLWVAHYTANANPKMPKGWDNWLLWQYKEDGFVNGISGDVDLNRAKIEETKNKVKTLKPLADDIVFDSINDNNKKNISKASWGETASIYPSKISNVYDDTKWDTDKRNQLVLCRNYVKVVSERNSNHQEGSPDLSNATEKKMAKYHLTDNFKKVVDKLGAIDVIEKDKEVKYFFMSNNPNAKHPGLSNKQQMVKSFGPFFEILTNEEKYYILFYKDK